MSSQFDDAAGNRANGDPLSQMVPTHTASDPSLLPLSAPDRLPRALPEQNLREYQSARAQQAGEALWHAYCESRGYEPADVEAFDEELFHSCIAENDFSKLTKKTRAFILASAAKSDPDWRYTWVRIFVKGQQKVNASTVNGPWKKAQTLAQFNDQWLLIFGPVVRYISRQDEARCPSHIFILGGKTPLDANAWAQRYIPGPGATTNDYTAFDQSQTAESLVLEMACLRHWGIPAPLVELYEHQKLHLHHQLGPSAVMRFTGEPGTYKFNTMFSEALCWLQYAFPPEHPRAHSGDDTLFPGHIPERKTWPALQRQITCVAKTLRLNHYGDFCGYVFSEHGVIRDPLVIAVKLGIAIEAGRFDAVAESFAQEVAVGNLMGDHAYTVLTGDQLSWRAAIGDALFERGGPAVRSLLAARTLSDEVAPVYDMLLRLGANAVADLKRRERLQAYAHLVEGRNSAMSQ